ncbi:major facilitator superfamily domain-containing protein [Mycena latifolia]|nr:major facilitator superfamily domain-containing protein [Mycena latifolia]
MVMATLLSSTPPSSMESNIDENTVLLPKAQQDPPIRTPLPIRQLTILMLVEFCDPLVSQSIHPYINKASELDITGGDEKKVGYYTGLASLFFLTEALTMLHWNRASDRIGRKPILLIGLFGTAVSMLCLGLSRTFWVLIASRCLSGLLNGNLGVVKSAVGDLTDPSNRAAAFPYINVVWDVGAAFGPLVGGLLARPQDHFPRLFSGTFWSRFPYFLPSLVVAGFLFLACFVVLAFFEETVPCKEGSSSIMGDVNAVDVQVFDVPSAVKSGPLPVRELLNFPVILSISNFASFSFLVVAISVLLPFLLAMPPEIGGLGLSPAEIGLLLSVSNAAMALFLALFCGRLIRHFGPARVFVFAISMCLPIFALLPVMSMVVQRTDVTSVVWVLASCVFALIVLQETGFTAIVIFVTASAPARSRGTVIGLAQSAASFAKALGPAMATSLFSLSVEKNLLGGYAVYAVLFGLSALALTLAKRLPAEVWEEVD